MKSWNIKGYTVEFIEDGHVYICEGKILPSITTIMQVKFKNKYAGVSKEVLQKAGERGTLIHSTIERFEKENIDSDIKELKDYKFLKKHYKFECIDNEVPVLLFIDNEPVAVGRLDMIIKIENELGLADIKTTSTLDLEYLAYQLNLYKIGYEQCYNKQINFLKAIHLKNGKRKFKDVPINEEMALNLVKEFQIVNK